MLDRKKLFYTTSVRCNKCREVFMWIICCTYLQWVRKATKILSLHTWSWYRDLNRRPLEPHVNKGYPTMNLKSLEFNQNKHVIVQDKFTVSKDVKSPIYQSKISEYIVNTHAAGVTVRFSYRVNILAARNLSNLSYFKYRQSIFSYPCGQGVQL